MPNEAKKLGENLKRIRTEKGISQSDIAKSLGVSRGFVSNIENGKRNPTLSTISRLAKAVDVPTEELFK
jgi:transcriptional regulator with XRE-family HTH domain